MAFELSNEQRKYFGLAPIEPHWEKVSFKGDSYRPDSILYYDGDVIKRHILITEEKYEEQQYDDLTRDRKILLPKTGKGKEKKLSASVLESRQPIGVYCSINNTGWILIGNHNSQTTFYNTHWEKEFDKNSNQTEISTTVNSFINSSPSNYLAEIKLFSEAKRKNCKFKPGDYFTYKINRELYGFGRVLLNVDKLRKSRLLTPEHGLNLIMAKPVLVKIYAYTSKSKKVDFEVLKKSYSLPSDYMMDNQFFYGQFEIIGYEKLTSYDMDFPLSYGRHIESRRQSSFLQWGLIHRELPTTVFNKYFVADNPFVEETNPSRKTSNPYGYYSIGFYPKNFQLYEIEKAIANNGFDYSKSKVFRCYFDLRNPANKAIRDEIMKAFDLDATKDYDANCKITGTPDSKTLIDL